MTTPNDALLDVKGLKKYFPVRNGVFQRVAGQVKAVDDVNLFVRQGETLGLVGESGCGKTTAGRSILYLTKPTAGQVTFRSRSLSGDGDMVDLSQVNSQELKTLRQEMQIIFQDPYSSLDPRMTVGQIVGEPLAAHNMGAKSEREDRIRDLLVAVGLKPDHVRRYPHEFSGGQRQRIGIARALAPSPQLIVADEPVSALDVSIQAQVTNLMLDLQEQYDLTYLFIGHDLSVVKYISDRVAVMYLGKVVELVHAEELFTNPKHPYSEALMSAVPAPDPDLIMDRIILEGDVPSPMNPPSGCYFHPRCRYAKEICRNETPEYRHLGNDHYVTCHRAEEITLRSLSHLLRN